MAEIVNRALADLDSYAIGLLNEEAGEIGQEVGKTLRFGLDTPSPVNSRYNGTTPRERLTEEVGDMLAAIWFAGEVGLIDIAAVNERAGRKIVLHRDPGFRNLAVWPPPEHADAGSQNGAMGPRSRIGAGPEPGINEPSK